MKNNINKLTANRKTFFNFVEKNNLKYRQGPDLYFHREVIKKIRKAQRNNSYNLLTKDPKFIELIYATLVSSDMNTRGAKMHFFNIFKKSICNSKSHGLIKDLSKYKLHRLKEKEVDGIIKKIEKLFSRIDIMESKSNVVGNSKVLHHLLPDLVIPIDRTHTLQFFYGNENDSKKRFKEILKNSYLICKKLKLSDEDVDNKKWNTSVPKLIDNALLSFKNKNLS